MPWAVAAVKEAERGEDGVANLVWRAECDWTLGTRHGTEDSMFEDEDEEVEDEDEPGEEDAGVPEAGLPVPCGASIGAASLTLLGCAPALRHRKGTTGFKLHSPHTGGVDTQDRTNTHQQLTHFSWPRGADPPQAPR